MPKDLQDLLDQLDLKATPGLLDLLESPARWDRLVRRGRRAQLELEQRVLWALREARELLVLLELEAPGKVRKEARELLERKVSRVLLARLVLQVQPDLRDLQDRSDPLEPLALLA